MKRNNVTPSWSLIFNGLLATIAAFLLLFIVAGFSGAMGIQSVWPLVVCLGIVAVLGGMQHALWKMGRSASDTKQRRVRTIARVLAPLTVIGLLVCVYTSVESLTLGYSYQSFVYQNIATGSLIAAGVLSIMLSTLQREAFDVSWLRSKISGLDEREVQQRRMVFEQSYKIASIVIVIFAWLAVDVLQQMPEIIANNAGEMPGHIRHPLVSLIVFIAVLPTLVAAWRND